MGTSKAPDSYEPLSFCPLRSMQGKDELCRTNCAWYMTTSGAPKGVCAIARISGDLTQIRARLEQ